MEQQPQPRQQEEEKSQQNESIDNIDNSLTGQSAFVESDSPNLTKEVENSEFQESTTETNQNSIEQSKERVQEETKEKKGKFNLSLDSLNTFNQLQSDQRQENLYPIDNGGNMSTRSTQQEIVLMPTVDEYNIIDEIISYKEKEFEQIKQLYRQKNKIAARKANKLLDSESLSNPIIGKIFFINFLKEFKDMEGPKSLRFEFEQIYQEISKKFKDTKIQEIQQLFELLELSENNFSDYKDFVEQFMNIYDNHPTIGLKIAQIIFNIEPIFVITLHNEETFTHQLYTKDRFSFRNYIRDLYDQYEFKNLPIDKRRKIIFKSSHIELIGQIEKQYEIQDLLEIQVGVTFEQMFAAIADKLNQKQNFSGELFRVVFEFLKKKISIQEVINNMIKILPECTFIPSTLLCILFENVNPEFRSLLQIFFNQYIPIPLLIPPLFQDQDYKIYPELYYAYEKNHSVLSFCLCSEEANYPVGKSELLNKLFGRQFQTIEKCDETQKQNILKFGFVEMQSDLHFSQPEHLIVADAHGLISKDVIRKIYQMFDTFIIHVNKNDSQEELEEEIQFIKNMNPKVFITIFIHDEKAKQTEIKKDFNNDILKFQVKCLRQANKDYIKQIIADFWEVFQKYYSNDIIAYDGNLAQKKEIKEQFLAICNQFNMPQESEHQNHQTITEFLEVFQQYKHNFKVEQFLSLSELFIQQCQILQILKTDLDLTMDQRVKLQNDIIMIQETFRNRSPTQIVEIFYQLIGQKNFLPALIDLSKRIKGFVQSEIVFFQNKRNELSQRYYGEIDEVKKDELRLEKECVQQDIYIRNFSYELLVRELYCIKKFLPEQTTQQCNFKNLMCQLVSQGQPFEILDGDNLHLISNVYEQIYKQINTGQKKTLVLSILGPQSSGKSTLLNFLFGTQFATSSARCTKGMYGAIMKINNHPDYQQLLILDTEGIQSAERADPLFDKKIVLYCLCISHVVLICNKGDMNNQMKQTIQLTLSLLKDIREAKIKDPSIYIILNALTDINTVQLDEQLQNLNIDVKFESEYLPFAFDRVSLESTNKSINLPSKDFAQKCQLICQKIMENKQNQSRYESISLHDWDIKALRLWNVIDNSRELMQYDNLKQQDQHKKLQEHINLIMKSIKNKNQEYIDDIKKQFEHLKTDLEIDNEINFKQFQEQLINVTQNQFKIKIQNFYEDEFNRYCRERNIAESLEKQGQELLRQQLQTINQDWKNYVNTLILEFKKQKSYYGENFINEQIRILLSQKKNQFKLEEANQQFEDLWLNRRQAILNSIKTKNEKENFDRTLVYYKAKTNLTTSDANVFVEMKQLNLTLNESILTEQLYKKDEKGQLNVLYFEGQNRLPVYQQLLQLQNQNDHGYFKIDNLFEEYEQIEYIHQNDLQNIFNHFNIKLKFNNIFQANKYKMSTNYEKQGKINFDQVLQQIKSAIKEISNEFKRYNVLLDDKFEQEIIIFFQQQTNDAILSREDIQGYLQEKQDEFSQLIENIVSKIHQYVSIIDNCLLLLDINQYQCQFLKFVQNQFQIRTETTITVDVEVFNKSEWILINKQQKIKIKTTFENNFLNELLMWFISPTDDRKYINETNINAGQQYFIEKMNWKKITFDIQNIVYFSFLKQTDHLYMDHQDRNLFKEQIEKFRDNEDLHLNFDEIIKFRDLNNDLIESVVVGVSKLVNDINQELESTRYQLSTTSIQLFHLFSLINIWVLFNEIDKIKVQEPIKIYDSTKEKFKKFFVSNLINDEASTDEQLAVFIVDDITKLIKEQALKNAQENFEKHINDNIQYFSAFDAMKSLDQIKDDKDKLLNYILNPIDLLEKEFQQQWKNLCYKGEDKKLIFDSDYKQYSNDQFDLCLELFTLLKNNLRNSQNLDLSINVFTIHNQNKDTLNINNETELAQVKYKNDYQQAAAILIVKFLSGKWDPLIPIQTEQFEDIKLIRPSQKNNKMLENVGQLKIIQNQLHNQKISNLDIFINKIIQLLRDTKGICYQNEITENQIDQNGIKKKFQSLYIGCIEHCKLCNRKCDKNHSGQSQEEMRHQCLNGHQLRAFCGNRLQRSDLASLKTCNDLSNTDQIVYHEKFMTWQDFKTLQSNWEFPDHDPANVLNKLNKEKYNNIWKIIGRDICEHYQSKGIPMKYIEPTEQVLPMMHYIFLLDDSSSMEGTPWTQLETAVKQFLDNLHSNQELKKYFKISIGIFDSLAREIMTEQDANPTLPENFLFEGGGTNFNDALKLAKTFIENSINSYDYFVIALLSDGESEYDQKILESIKNIPKLEDRIRFASIAFGIDADKKTLETIAKYFDGKLQVALTIEDLVKSFTEVLNID